MQSAVQAVRALGTVPATSQSSGMAARVVTLNQAVDAVLTAATEKERDERRRELYDAVVALKNKADELTKWLDRADRATGAGWTGGVGSGYASDEQDALWIDRLRVLERAYDALSDARKAL